MDSVSRFGRRVDNYVKYRPSYPSALIDKLVSRCSLNDSSRIADIGSGTGIFTRLLLDRGFHVYGVEPGADMRAAAESTLAENKRFVSVHNKAESTGLPEHSIDLVTVAQAFHWLDIDSFRTECLRILKPNGWVGLIWNSRRTKGNAFLEGYEKILQGLSGDYKRVNHAEIPRSEIARFFGGESFQLSAYSNSQDFDWEGLLGRSLSSSYVPMLGDEDYEGFESQLKNLFSQHAASGKVRFEYEAELFLGQLVG